MSDDTISVFISYSHDSPQHEARVLVLADRLRADGIDAMIDQYQTAPPEGWQFWMEKQIRDAKFVLLVCTETYLRRVMKEDAGKGLGVMWESTIIYSHLYNAGGVNEKFIPVVFDRADTKHIPVPVQPTTYYIVSDDADYESLYRRLTNQPATPAPTIGARRVLPPLPRPTAYAQPPNYPTIQPNLVHPYALQANFTGRAQERAELTAWLADDSHPICALVAMGGMGKSALAWYWLTQDILKSEIENRKLDGVLWWSFYEGEASFAKFVDEALKYVSGHEIDAAHLPTTYDRAQELRRELQTKRVLFVLDGFERQLRAYARLDAAYQRDATADESHEARACVDPIAARLLRDIAAGATRAKVLITSRLMVSDLEDRAGDALAGVHKCELKALARDDAITFMHAQGVTKGTPAEIATVCEAYGNHPLSLRLLSGLIARDTHTPGDIAAAPRHDVHADLVQRQHHVLEQSYNALPDKERTLLSRIAAFRSPMTYDALAIFNEFDDEAEFDAALYDLETRGLVQRDTLRNSYDLHPIVRHYCYERLTDKEGVHTRLRDYFSATPRLRPETVESVEDLAPVIELYYHTIRAGLYDRARMLYSGRLQDLLFNRFGVYQTQIALLLGLFPDGEDHMPRLQDPSAQAATLNDIASAYSHAGQPRRAMALFELSNEPDTKLGDRRNLAVGLGNIAYQQISLGELAKAEENLLHSIKICGQINWRLVEAPEHEELGRLLAHRGAFDDATRELNTAHELLVKDWVEYIDKRTIEDQSGFHDWHELFDARPKEGEPTDAALLWSYRAQCALLLNNTHDALEAARQAYALAHTQRNEHNIIWSEWLLGAALTWERKDINAAATHLTDALGRCRRISFVELEPDILLAWARWHHARGNAQEAHAHAEDALAIADRCEYRLKQAEIHNFLARLALDEADRRRKTEDGRQTDSVVGHPSSISEALAEARKHAETARERAWCDGPPHCYKPALDEAERMLKEL